MSKYENNSYGIPPEDSNDEPSNIEPVYQQMLGHLAKAHKIASEYPNYHNLGVHLPTIKRIQKLVVEAAGHSASFLPGRAAGCLNEALVHTESVAKGFYLNPTFYLKESKNPKDPFRLFHKHMGLFADKATKESGHQD